MTRVLTPLALASLLVAAGPSPTPTDPVQGNWEGSWKDAGGEGKLSAKIIGRGGDQYHSIFTAFFDRVTVFEIPAKAIREGNKLTFAGKADLGPDAGGAIDWTAEVSDGKLIGRYTGANDKGVYTLSRVANKPPTLGQKPPDGAVVLFDGRDLSAWQTADGKPADYPIADGAMEARGTLVRTKQEFTDYRLHLEFLCPYQPEKRGQGRGNNGVWLQGRQAIEIQILDSFGLKPAKNECGALYSQEAPRVIASLPPLEWQTYDITLTAARFDSEGKVTKKARVTVIHNGTKIIDDVEASGGAASGPILLHYHHDPVRFRNIWLVPVTPTA